MAVYDIYSKRNKPSVDVFSYEELPKKLKIQIIFIWNEFFEQFYDKSNKQLLVNHIWQSTNRTLCQEYGKKTLVDWSWSYKPQEAVESFFEHNKLVEECLDVVELVFRFIRRYTTIYKERHSIEPMLHYSFDEAIDDLNKRFLENGVGYEFREGEIIRVDNKLLHQEVVIPALHFLSSPEFKNANEEYLSAHEHFRHQRTKECLNDSLKAFETTLKIICDLNGWEYEKSKATASALIRIILEKELIPIFLQQHLTALRSTLESGVPTVRNKMSGHGQGAEGIEVPMHYASYMLYLTGTTINFLVSCQQELKAKHKM